MADRKGEASEANSFPKSSEIKNLGNIKSEISVSRVSGELEYELFCADSKHEADMQSSDGIPSAQPTPVKSDISTEISLPLSSGSFEMDARKAHNLNASVDGLNGRGHDPQQRTESSCSNSLSTILPVSFSNHSNQETSKETSSLKNRVVSADSPSSKGLNYRLGEPVTASSESGACHDHDILNTSSNLAEKSIHLEVSGESKDSMAVKAKQIVEIGPEVIDKIKADSWANEPSDLSLKKPGNVALENQATFGAGFDLNEDINAKGVEDCVHPSATAASSLHVIQVVAKAGRPNGQPQIPLRFEGRLDWKGSAGTSAFRPAGLSRTSERKSCLRNNELKTPRGFMGIDLNVAAVEDNAVDGMPMEHQGISSPSPLHESHSEAGSKRSKNRPLIDLNCGYNAAEEFAQPSKPPESGNPVLVDLNMDGNAITIADQSDNLHWPNRDCRPQGNNTSDSANPSRHYFNFIGHDYYSNAHVPVAAPNILQPVELLQSAASLQPKLPYGPPTLNLQSYPSNGPHHFVPGGLLPAAVRFSGTVPYARYSHEQGINPGFLNPGMVHTSFCTPQLVHIVHEQGASNITASLPSRDARTEENLSASRMKMDEARGFSYISANPAMGEQLHQEYWYDASSMKRKEPAGGFRHYQLGYK